METVSAKELQQRIQDRNDFVHTKEYTMIGFGELCVVSPSLGKYLTVYDVDALGWDIRFSGSVLELKDMCDFLEKGKTTATLEKYKNGTEDQKDFYIKILEKRIQIMSAL